jgi:hypothetical protein
MSAEQMKKEMAQNPYPLVGTPERAEWFDKYEAENGTIKFNNKLTYPPTSKENVYILRDQEDNLTETGKQGLQKLYDILIDLNKQGAPALAKFLGR